MFEQVLVLQSYIFEAELCQLYYFFLIIPHFCNKAFDLQTNTMSIMFVNNSFCILWNVR